MVAEREVLVVEDEAVIRGTLKRLLERHRYDVSEAASVKESLELFDLDQFDVIVSDLKLPGAPGTDLIKATSAPVLIMTSYSSIRSAIDSMKLGAADYIAKPFDHSELLASLEKILKERGGSGRFGGNRGSRGAAAPDRGHGESKRGESRPGAWNGSGGPRLHDATRPPGYGGHAPIPGMIGRSPVMRELFRRVHKVAGAGSPVLIEGESGTGKELVARAIHDLGGGDNPSVAVSCAAIPENLIEAELFGHERITHAGGTETRTGLVEAADGGTLFLDEIGELPLSVQGRLVRVLQDGEIHKLGAAATRRIDFRLVAATQRDLKQLVAERKFREDLYYRINVMRLRIPPLRERGADILELANEILRRTCNRLKSPAKRFDPSAERAINGHPWPGNVRELENAIERAVVLGEGEWIGDDFLAGETAPRRSAGHGGPADKRWFNGGEAAEASQELSLEDYFQHFVLEHQDSLTETELAKKLGISRKCLWERRQRFGIPRRRKQSA